MPSHIPKKIEIVTRLILQTSRRLEIGELSMIPEHDSPDSLDCDRSFQGITIGGVFVEADHAWTERVVGESAKQREEVVPCRVGDWNVVAATAPGSARDSLTDSSTNVASRIEGGTRLEGCRCRDKLPSSDSKRERRMCLVDETQENRQRSPPSRKHPTTRIASPDIYGPGGGGRPIIPRFSAAMVGMAGGGTPLRDVFSSWRGGRS